MNSIFDLNENDWRWSDLPPEDEFMLPYHKPVLARECIRELDVQSEGTYVDVTFGGGGHSELMIQMLGDRGRLIAFDQDADAFGNAAEWKQPNFTFVRANFRHLERYLDSLSATPVDGILADLGISSFQIDEPSKGFSTRFDGPLDMRMNASQELSAEDVINGYSQDQLFVLFRDLGEVKNPRTLAERIIQARAQRSISTTGRLREVIWPLAPRKQEFRYLAQVFQAIRIQVNDEMAALRELLEQSARVIKPGGRLVVLTYHSLEDRLVKNYMAKSKFEGELDKDIYGNEQGRLFRPVWPKPITPSESEVADNPRARSAKLRVGVRV